MVTRLGWSGIMIVTGWIPSFNLEALINHDEGRVIKTLGTVLAGWAGLHMLIESPEFESIEKRYFSLNYFFGKLCSKQNRCVQVIVRSTFLHSILNEYFKYNFFAYLPSVTLMHQFFRLLIVGNRRH